MSAVERGLTQARSEFSTVLDEAEHGGWSWIQDRQGRRSAVIAVDLLAEVIPDASALVATWHPVAQARAQLPTLHRQLEEAWIGISRRRSTYCWVDATDLEARLRGRFPFTTQVIFGEDGSVSLWIPELAIYASAATYEKALTDLVEECAVYVDEWEADLRFAPNHRAREGWVRRLQVLPDDEARTQALLGA